MRNDFCVFILCYKKPDKCKTLKALNKYGYTGDYYLVLSNDDPTINRYIELSKKYDSFDKDVMKVNKTVTKWSKEIQLDSLFD